METLALSFIFIQKKIQFAKNTYSIMRKIEDVKDEEQKGLLRTERANLPVRGGSEYKLIFGIHVDVGRLSNESFDTYINAEDNDNTTSNT